ncbi:MAG: adenylate/guanylate cyclase domain-containing protein [Variovorax sp.]|nr:MAG: adenylate/guanylate cyclase domain-containing protein [Variovorax sp.]
MFCDMVGSTALSGRLDPEDLDHLIRSYHSVVTTAVAPYEGHVARYLGDGVLVYFGYPYAYEDNAIRAARAALNIVKTLRSRPTAATSNSRSESVLPPVRLSLARSARVQRRRKMRQAARHRTLRPVCRRKLPRARS